MFDQLRLFSLLGLAGVIELVGRALLLVGFFTRPVAFILSGEMAVAYSWRMRRAAFFQFKQLTIRRIELARICARKTIAQFLIAPSAGARGYDAWGVYFSAPVYNQQFRGR
jgi:uncharacterized membrane protein YphA (DoxX/SURF4 family)